MGCFCKILLIAKYFAISEMYRICLCTNGVAPRVPYPLEVSEVRWWFCWWRNLSDATSLMAKYTLIAKFGLLLLNFADDFTDGVTSLEFCNYFANGEIYANSEVWHSAPELRWWRNLTGTLPNISLMAQISLIAKSCKLGKFLSLLAFSCTKRVE